MHSIRNSKIFKDFLDKSGQEIIRVDRSIEEGAYKVVEKTALQDKSNRYYLFESENKKLENVWFSALDLNVENEQVQLQHNPTPTQSNS